MDNESYRRLPHGRNSSIHELLDLDSIDLTKASIAQSHELGDFPAEDTRSTAEESLHQTCSKRVTIKRQLASWVRAVLRSLHLLLFVAIGPWKKEKEEPKVTLRTGWTYILTGLLIHVLPTAASITLIYMNMRVYFLGSSVSTLAFQFLAKFLELLAQASVCSTVFVYLRSLYTSTDPVPFGALFAGLQVTSVSYLWSLEFAGAVTSEWYKRSRKLVFLILIPLSTILAVAIGPCFAIAMTPTQGTFPYGLSRIWLNATEDQIFPVSIDPNALAYSFSSNCSADCSYVGWQNAMRMAQSVYQYQPSPAAPWYDFAQNQTLRITQDTQPNREIRCSTTSILIEVLPDYTFVTSTATVPIKFISMALDTYAYYDAPIYGSLEDNMGTNFTVSTRQPLVSVNCSQATWSSPTNVSLASLTHKPGDEQNDFSVETYYLEDDSLRRLNQSNSSLLEWVFIDSGDLPQSWPGTKPSLWVVFNSPESQYPYGTNSVCAIYASYGHTKNIYQPYASSPVVSSEGTTPSVDTLQLSASWVNRTLPDMDILRDNGLAGADVATFLATSLAVSLAQWPEQLPSPLNGNTSWTEWWFDTHLASGYTYQGEDTYSIDVLLSWSGYGWHMDQPTKIVAITVLIVYCVFTLVSMVLTFSVHRVYSNAWDSIGELTTLAMLSRSSDKLRNTSAGVETVGLYKLPVNIRAVDNDHLEILFEDEHDGVDVGLVEKNVEY